MLAPIAEGLWTDEAEPRLIGGRNTIGKFEGRFVIGRFGDRLLELGIELLDDVANGQLGFDHPRRLAFLHPPHRAIEEGHKVS